MSEQSPYSQSIPLLLQIFDSAFPTGGYAHSFGLEGLTQLGIVYDEESFDGFLQTDVIYSLSRVDLPLFRMAYTAYQEEHFLKLSELDELAYASKPTGEIRQASARTGKQLLILIEKIEEGNQDVIDECSLVKNYLKNTQIGTTMGAVSAIFKIPLDTALHAFATKTIHAFGRASVKLLHFGPYQVQRIMFRQQEHIIKAVQESMNVSIDMIGSNSLRWDLASASHERAESRLFIS